VVVGVVVVLVEVEVDVDVLVLVDVEVATIYNYFDINLYDGTANYSKILFYLKIRSSYELNIN